MVHIPNIQRDLVVMRLIRIELIVCSTSKVDRVKVHIHVVLLAHVQLRGLRLLGVRTDGPFDSSIPTLAAQLVS